MSGQFYLTRLGPDDEELEVFEVSPFEALMFALLARFAVPHREQRKTGSSSQSEDHSRSDCAESPRSELELLYERQALWIDRHEQLSKRGEKRVGRWLDQRCLSEDPSSVEKELLMLEQSAAIKFARLLEHYQDEAREATLRISALRRK